MRPTPLWFALVALVACNGSDPTKDTGETDTAIDPDDTPGETDTVDSPSDTPNDTPSDTPSDQVGVANLLPGDLVLTEIMVDSTACADDDAEYVEVLYKGSALLDLFGLEISDRGTLFSVPTHAVILPNTRFILYRAPLSASCYGFVETVGQLPYPSTIALSNGGDRVGLSAAGTLLDEVDYTGWTVPIGAALQLDPRREGPALNDDAGAWCAATTAIASTTDLGSPGAANAACDDLAPVDTSTPVDTDPGTETGGGGGSDTDSGSGAPVATPADLILSEVCDPTAYQARFVEILNVSGNPVSLDGWSIQRYANGGTSPSNVALPAVTLAPGARYVVANSGWAEADWLAAYGTVPDLFNSTISGNGDDAYALAFQGTVVDVFGVIGVDGTGTDWEYEDDCAARVPSVTGPTDAFNIAEWAFGVVASPDGETVAPPVDTSVGIETADTGDTADSADSSAPPIDTFPTVVGGPLLISEVCDPSDFTYRFVELANPGPGPTNLLGRSLYRFSNGALTGAEIVLPDRVLQPGETFVIASTGPTAAAWQQTYGTVPDLFSGSINGNGDDVYALGPSGAAVAPFEDVYGEYGIDGTGTAWEYTDTCAARLPGIVEANPTFTLSEWSVGSPATPGSPASDPGPGDTAAPTDTPVDTPIDTPVDTPADTPVDTGPASPTGTVLLSEVCDPLDFAYRYIELWNPGPDAASLAGRSVYRFSNGGLTGSEIVLPSVVLAAGETWLIASNGAATASWQATYGVTPDQTSAQINGNGNDVYAIGPSGTPVAPFDDVYGEYGVDGVGTAWDYTNACATRRYDVTTPNPTFTLPEWYIGGSPTPDAPTNPPPVDTGAADTGAPIDTPVDTPIDTPVDTPTDTPVDTPIDTPVDTPTDTPVDTGPTPVGRALLTEICDPLDANARFIELTNVGDGTLDLSTLTLGRYANGGTTPTLITLAGLLAPGDVWFIATSTLSDLDWVLTYGDAPDQRSGTITGNGDDAWALLDGTTIVDVFGEIGVDGTGTAWDYTDRCARRVDGAPPVPTFDVAQWVFGDPESPGFLPAPVQDTATFDTAFLDTADSAAIADTGYTPDTTVVDTFVAVDTALADTGAVDTGAVFVPYEAVILTEICDPSAFDYRFVELTNVGNVPFGLLGYAIHRYSNGGTTPGSITLPDVVLLPGERYLVATTSSSVATDAAWLATYGVVPDLRSGTVSGNGDDVYAFGTAAVGGLFSVLDVYGVIGIDGTGTPWEYTDQCAARDGAVVAPNTAWTASEWTLSVLATPGY